MAYEQKNNTASMFANERKQADTHADWQGTALIDGKEYYLNAWNKQGSKGAFFSLTFKEKQPKPADYQAPDNQSSFNDSDMPF